MIEIDGFSLKNISMLKHSAAISLALASEIHLNLFILRILCQLHLKIQGDSKNQHTEPKQIKSKGPD